MPWRTCRMGVLAAISALSAFSLRAYVPLRWNTGMRAAWAPGRVIAFSLNDATAAGVSNAAGGGETESAVRAALAAWEDIPTASIQFGDLKSTSIASAAPDGTNLITMADTPENREILKGDPGAPAVTRVYFNPATGEITESDIVLNPASAFSTNLAWRTYDLQAVLTHEIGHALGCDHASYSGDTMFALVGTGAFFQRSLSADAIAFATATYPASARAASMGGFSGRVTTSSGAAVFGASVTAVNLDRNQVSTALSERDGTYRISGAAPGRYALYAEPLDGPALPSQFMLQGAQAFYGPVNTSFRTTPVKEADLGQGGAPQELTIDFAVPDGAPTLNIDRVGRADPASGIGYLSAGPVAVYPGESVRIWLGGQNTWKATYAADIRVLGTGIDLDTAQGISVLTGADSAAGISVAARVAADATAGPRTLVLKVGVEQAAATGSVVVMPRAPAVSRLYFPYLRSSSGEYTGIAIANPDRTRPAVTRIFARDQYGALLWNPEATVPADVTLPGGAQSARLGMEVFRFPAGVPQEGSVTIESDSTVLQGFCLTGDFGNTRLDGAEAFTRGYRELYFPDVLQDSVMDTEIHLMNTGGFAQPVDLVLATGNGEIMLHRVIPRGGKIGETVAKLFGFRGELHSAYVKASAPDAVLAGFQLVRQPDAVFGLNALPPEGGGATLFAPQFAVGDLGLHLETRLNLVNAGSAEAAVTVEVLDENGRPLVPASWNGALAAGGQAAVDVGRACGIEQGQGYIRVSAPEGARLIGNVVYGDGDPTARGLQFSAALPLFSAGARNFLFSHVAQGEGYYTGIALLASQGARTTVEVCDREGRTRGSVVLELAPGQRLVSLLSALLPETAGQMYGYIRVTSDRPVMGFELFGTSDGRLLSAVPPQRLPE